MYKFQQLSRPASVLGFTLVELAIVLVIIGLLVGGVLVGKTLYETSVTRNDINKINGYISAMSTFKLKYNCLPGDCAKASNFFSGEVNGDGNGSIDNSGLASNYTAIYCAQAAVATEMGGVNSQLSLAGLLEIAPYSAGANWSCTRGKGVYGLASRSNICAFKSYYGNSNLIRVGCGVQTTGVSGIALYSQNSTGMLPSRAQAVDAKIDDGLPQSGRVNASYQPINSANTAIYHSTALNSCTVLSSGTYYYNVANDTLNTTLAQPTWQTGCSLYLYDFY